MPREPENATAGKETVSNSTHILHETCPDASGEEIEVALQVSGGDPNVAAQSLLGGKQISKTNKKNYNFYIITFTECNLQFIQSKLG